MAEVPALVSMILGRLKRVAFGGVFFIPERLGCVLYHLWNRLRGIESPFAYFSSMSPYKK